MDEGRDGREVQTGRLELWAAMLEREDGEEEENREKWGGALIGEVTQSKNAPLQIAVYEKCKFAADTCFK